MDDLTFSAVVDSIRTLLNVIERSPARTLTALTAELKSTTNSLMEKIDERSTSSSLESACKMFRRFITLDNFENENFETCRLKMVTRAELFLNRCVSSRQKIVEFSERFLVDGAVILTHSFSRSVFQLLEAAAKAKHFQVYITISEPDRSGVKMREQLESIGIPAFSILDASVGSIAERISFVLVGAQAVVESGGIINQIGTFNIAIAAREMNKPFYVATETFKFVRHFPLNNRNLPEEFQTNSSDELQHPLVDYTPPSYITLFFTDIGPLTTVAVSEELIKLYV